MEKKKKSQNPRTGDVAQWWRACLEGVRPWTQSLVQGGDRQRHFSKEDIQWPINNRKILYCYPLGMGNHPNGEAILKCQMATVQKIKSNQCWQGGGEIGASYMMAENSLTLPSKELLSWVSVAHTCNLNYLGG
jgi:hypothetical protein